MSILYPPPHIPLIIRIAGNRPPGISSVPKHPRQQPPSDKKCATIRHKTRAIDHPLIPSPRHGRLTPMVQSIGYTTGTIADQNRRNWQNDGPRPIGWSAWYPTDAPGTPRTPTHVFDLDPLLPCAPPRPGPLPTVLLSHGTGGTAETLAWLARALAEAGHLVIGAQHHGNCGLEPYAAEGFLAWWERAADISCLLTAQTSGTLLPCQTDPVRTHAIGFSLGGHATLALAGALTDMAAFSAWDAAQDAPMSGPPEFPDAAENLPNLLATSASFAAAWARQGHSYHDPRFAQCIAIAPPPTVRAFTPASLAAITAPVTLMTGGADTEAPTETCADWLTDQNPAFTHIPLGDDITHYAFLGLPTDPKARQTPIFANPPPKARAAIQCQTANHILTRLP